MPLGPFRGPWDAYVNLIEWCLREITDFTGNFGLAIIVFTILLKTLILPLTVKSIRSTAAMQELQPKIKDIQKKYGKDRQRANQEVMRLYSEYSVNPLSGCLPMLLQIPIFMGLYFAISHISKTDPGSFLWLDNLNKSDPYKILPIMAGVFQFIQTKMMRPANAPKVTDPQQQMMNSMMNFMPLMVVIFGWQFAAGPVLYWATQSVYSVIQQWFITGWGQLKNWAPWMPELPEHRRLGHRKTPLKSVDPDAEPKGFMGRMQRQMQQSQATAEERRGTSSTRKTSAPSARSGTKSGTKPASAAAPVDGTSPRIVRAKRGDEHSPDLVVETEAPTGKRAKRGRAQAALADHSVSGAADDGQQAPDNGTETGTNTPARTGTRRSRSRK